LITILMCSRLRVPEMLHCTLHTQHNSRATATHHRGHTEIPPSGVRSRGPTMFWFVPLHACDTAYSEESPSGPMNRQRVPCVWPLCLASEIPPMVFGQGHAPGTRPCTRAIGSVSGRGRQHAPHEMSCVCSAGIGFQP
jgi:hypothetical protein